VSLKSRKLDGQADVRNFQCDLEGLYLVVIREEERMQHRFNISHPSNKFGFTGAENAMLWETVYQVTSRIELGLHISQCHIPTVFNTLSGASTDMR
jgi:hypothetical protein